MRIDPTERRRSIDDGSELVERRCRIDLATLRATGQLVDVTHLIEPQARRGGQRRQPRMPASLASDLDHQHGGEHQHVDFVDTGLVGDPQQDRVDLIDRLAGEHQRAAQTDEQADQVGVIVRQAAPSVTSRVALESSSYAADMRPF